MDREHSQPGIIHPSDAAILRRVAFFHNKRIRRLRRTEKVKKVSERDSMQDGKVLMYEAVISESSKAN